MPTDVHARSTANHATVHQDHIADLHQQLDAQVASVRATFGAAHPMYIGGAPIEAREQFEDRSPIDTRMLLGRVQRGSRENVAAAVKAAQSAFPRWSTTRWEDRVDMLRRLAQTIHARRLELSAIMGYETGKSRMECLGDVEEAADLIEYYCRQFEEHDGFVRRMASLNS